MASPPTTNARSTPAPSSQAIRSARCARSRIIRAERCGTARKPRAWSCSHSATVASMPLAGDAVTDTVAPAGRCGGLVERVLERHQLERRVARGRAATAPRRRGVSRESAAERARAQTSESGIDALRFDDELEERLVDRGVDRRRLVLGEHPLPDRVGALRPRRASRPRATARSCCCRRSPSGRRRSRSWPACAALPRKCWPGPFARIASSAWPFSDRSTPLTKTAGHPALVGVEDELLVADGEPALEPAGGVEHEVDAGEDRRLEGRGRLVGGLGVGDLRGAQVAAGAERDAEPARERGHHVEDERRLRRPERRRARLHRDRAREASRGPPARPGRTSWTNAIPPSASARVWAHDAGGGHRRHRAGEDERRQERRLVRLGVGARGAEHRRVPDQRRVGVDQARGSTGWSSR